MDDLGITLSYSPEELIKLVELRRQAREASRRFARLGDERVRVVRNEAGKEEVPSDFLAHFSLKK